MFWREEVLGNGGGNRWVGKTDNPECVWLAEIWCLRAAAPCFFECIFLVRADVFLKLSFGKRSREMDRSMWGWGRAEVGRRMYTHPSHLRTFAPSQSSTDLPLMTPSTANTLGNRTHTYTCTHAVTYKIHSSLDTNERV